MITDDHVYKTVELTGTSRSTFEAAVQSAIRTASKTLRHLRWFEVVEVRGEIEQGSDIHWQVMLKVGFTVEPSEDPTGDHRRQTSGKKGVRQPGGPSVTKRRTRHHQRL
ncbi:MAG: dodecin [Nitrospira sp.]